MNRFNFPFLGAKVQPWSLLRFIESVRACTFWNYNNTSAQNSLADFHVVLQNHLFFVVSANVTIHKYFYDEESPKFPLYVNASLDHVGRSSKRLSYRLYHPDVETEYVTCHVDDVLVSNISRKPVGYPDWWVEKFAHLCKGEKSIFELPRTQLSKTYNTSYQVTSTDIDTYKHANWSSYVKFCFESVYKNVYENKYDKITQNHIDSGLKSFSLVYKNESSLYDNLNICTREDKFDETVVYGDVFKEDGTLCFQMLMDFYNNSIKDKSKLLLCI